MDDFVFLLRIPKLDAPVHRRSEQKTIHDRRRLVLKRKGSDWALVTCKLLSDIIASHLVPMNLSTVSLIILTTNIEVIRVIFGELHASNVDVILTVGDQTFVFIFQINNLVRGIKHLLVPDTETAVIGDRTDVVGLLTSDDVDRKDRVSVTIT